MSIERDRDFEQLEDIAAMMAENPGIEFENGKYVYYGLDPRTAFAVVYIGGAWAGWQAAKAQEVPEGFVLVPTELLKDINNIAVNEFHKWKIREQNMPEICEYMQDLSYYIGIQK